ncbi:hypothetical protein F442_12203 [Phytophthora nicotianae P10297]|uniref:Hydrogen voltage-gated channel 1 n=4 Tax=Phytophthora nicotianae TaxID=4792 RepID=W2Q0M6_PHYN3|nr:hypothetical protein PPTG_13889 [Phytophthora nicotianae INRA-310]ETI42620.1 hypothetical protein F443_12290 [Phytophthora nicotianae P1569]ETL89243.1 hypothetical protein L917_11780 [Phytophthora nicotianae]ETN06094.1 hypothetical protein PPTG_13889 [Phytophthora nicotianae INRA-310]ETP40439.1 hypothetical protein F442_12203 [Phytophthora nicotianae P10297]
MERRKIRRKTGEIKATSDAESTVSTRSSTSSNSSTSWKQKQRRLKAQCPNQDNSNDTEIDSEEDAHFTSLEGRLGAILETTEAQVVMILLIALDIGCTAVEIHLHDQLQLQQLTTEDAPLLVRIATRLVESFTGFTLFLFLIELTVLLAAFRHKFFAHAGYILDLVVVSISLGVELYAQTKGRISTVFIRILIVVTRLVSAARLLGILRVWRVLRLIRRLVDQERAAHDTTRQLLEQEQLKLLHVRMQKDAAHESLKREYESRAGLEQLLRSYKDEIVTLKEALQIAAQAVAEATMAESPPFDNEYSEVVDAETSFGSYPAADNEYREEYYHHEVAAVHPTELQHEYLQESEESENYHQEATAVHPTEVHEENYYLEAAVNSMEEQIETRSDNEFEDAADE